MALSEAQRKANNKYIKEHYKQVKLSMPNDEAEKLEEHCRKFGYTKAGFIRQAIKEAIALDHDTRRGKDGPTQGDGDPVE